MNQDIERFWLNAQMEAQRKFGQELEKFKDLNLDLWKSIITIQAAILGISIALLGYLKTNPNPFLISTWIIEIISIALGFLLFRVHIDQHFKSSFGSFKYSMDINEINLLDSQGKFIGNEEEKKGMAIASLMDIIPEKEHKMFSDSAKNLAEKYRGELPSRQLFKEVKETTVDRLIGLVLKHQVKVINVFYFLTAISFLTLLLSILVKCQKSLDALP